jgi:hypothetical protein
VPSAVESHGLPTKDFDLKATLLQGVYCAAVGTQDQRLDSMEVHLSEPEGTNRPNGLRTETLLPPASANPNAYLGRPALSIPAD